MSALDLSKTTGELRTRARAAAVRVAVVTVPLAAAFLLASQVSHGKPATDVTAALAAVTLLGAVAAAFRGREGWAFAGTAVTIALAVATLFGDRWPDVLPSTTRAACRLTVDNASSAHYALLVMTWVAVIFTPVVLLYQGWTYWVSGKQLARPGVPTGTGPGGAVPGRTGPGPQAQAVPGQ